jgi:uncharacterized membrane protein
VLGSPAVASFVFDIASRIVDAPAFLARGAAWLIAVGLIGALLAALVGLLDFLQIPPGTPAFRVGLTHLGLNLVVVAAYIGNFFWRYADYGTVQSVRIGQLVLSAVSLAVLVVSGYLGGQLAYRYGVRSRMNKPRPRDFSPITDIHTKATHESQFRSACRTRTRAGN